MVRSFGFKSFLKILTSNSHTIGATFIATSLLLFVYVFQRLALPSLKILGKVQCNISFDIPLIYLYTRCASLTYNNEAF